MEACLNEASGALERCAAHMDPAHGAWVCFIGGPDSMVFAAEETEAYMRAMALCRTRGLGTPALFAARVGGAKLIREQH